MELKLVRARAPAPPLAEEELKPPLVEDICRDMEDRMAGWRAEQAERKLREGHGAADRPRMTRLFIFLRQGWLLDATQEGGASWAGCGEAPSPAEVKEEGRGLSLPPLSQSPAL